MLEVLTVNQAHFIALLARTARLQRDAVLGNVAEADLGALTPARGEHNPIAELGFDPLPNEAPQPAAIREAIASLSIPARNELYVLMRIGQGHLAARNWHRGLSEAEALGETGLTAAILDDPDLHDHIAKALYEGKLAS